MPYHGHPRARVCWPTRVALTFVVGASACSRTDLNATARHHHDDCDPFARVQTCQPFLMEPELVMTPLAESTAS
jgi:hypothetical protein